MVKRYGLLGKTLSHSFSKNYFENKFQKENIVNATYDLFELATISEFPVWFKNKKDLIGLNVTIPYKEKVMDYLTSLDESAKAVGAVNCIKVKGEERIGYNTDVFGFSNSIKPFLKSNHQKALILGTGGGSKAVHHVLTQLGIDCFYVSREKKAKANTFLYEEISAIVMQHFMLIVNCTPVGMFPHENEFPDIPYEFITPDHFLFDLIYNPEETVFLKRGKEKGALTQNGMSMLRLQAERAWEIWNT